MLRISRLTDYGTLVMSQMAGTPDRVFSASDLAGRLGLGAATVSKILKTLARHELVVGVRGQHGGYSLSRPPERITLADIVDALEEQPFGLTECSSQAGICEIELSCRVRGNWRRINDVVRGSLEAVSLADMVQPEQEAAPLVFHRQRQAENPDTRATSAHRTR